MTFRKLAGRARRSRGALAPSPQSRLQPVAPSGDEALAEAASAGSRAAFEQLVDRYGGRVAAVIERRVGDHHAALDLTQDVWVRVFRRLDTFDPERSFRSWLFAIALNAARDEGRRRRRSPVAFVDELPAAAAECGPGAATPDAAAIERSLARVPEPYRTALVLVDVERLSYDEAAGSAGCALGTMKSRVARGRAAFRDAWVRTETRYEARAGARRSRGPAREQKSGSAEVQQHEDRM